MTKWRVRIACWIPNATNAHSEYVVILIAFPLQQLLHERASLLRYTCIVCLDTCIQLIFDQFMFEVQRVSETIGLKRQDFNVVFKI